jgi:hypothetical protein
MLNRLSIVFGLVVLVSSAHAATKFDITSLQGQWDCGGTVITLKVDNVQNRLTLDDVTLIITDIDRGPIKSYPENCTNFGCQNDREITENVSTKSGVISKDTYWYKSIFGWQKTEKTIEFSLLDQNSFLRTDTHVDRGYSSVSKGICTRK